MSASPPVPLPEETISVRIHGSDDLVAALAAAGIEQGGAEQGLVFAPAGEIAGPPELEQVLLDAYRLSQEAMAAQAPIVYAVDGPALYGHAGALDAALATGLLGGARSLAAEAMRKDFPVHAVTAAEDCDPRSLAAAIAWLLRSAPGTGQVIHVDSTHVGRPPA